MNIASLMTLIGEQPFFDLATVTQLTGEARGTIKIQLSRWTAKGILHSLRRGMYAIAPPYCRTPLNPAELANRLHRPSYLSSWWALGFYGLIPEKVTIWTSVTSKATHRFENAFGVFEYHHVKREAFFGCRAVEIQGRKVLVAEPEKALLDLWHLEDGEWTSDRMESLRFQNFDAVDPDKLSESTRRFASPRLDRAVRAWRDYAGDQEKGTVTL